MNKMLFGIFALALFSMAVSAQTFSETHTPGITAGVRQFVDTTFSAVTIDFGTALDSGTSDNAAAANPYTLTNTANSNTAVDTYLQCTDLTTLDPFTIAVGNFKVSLTLAGAKTALVKLGATPQWLSCAGAVCAANEGYIENQAKNTAQDMYFWLDIPAGQDAGSYTGTLTIMSIRNGGTPESP